MATTKYGGLITKIATSSLAGKLGYAVKLDTNTENVVLSSAKTDQSMGLIVAENIAGGQVTIAHRSSNQIVLGKIGSGGCSVGSKLAPTTDGTLIVTTTSGDEVVARALEAGSQNDLVRVAMVNEKHA